MSLNPHPSFPWVAKLTHVLQTSSPGPIPSPRGTQLPARSLARTRLLLLIKTTFGRKLVAWGAELQQGGSTHPVPGVEEAPWAAGAGADSVPVLGKTTSWQIPPMSIPSAPGSGELGGNGIFIGASLSHHVRTEPDPPCPPASSSSGLPGTVSLPQIPEGAWEPSWHASGLSLLPALAASSAPGFWVGGLGCSSPSFFFPSSSSSFSSS